MAWVDTCCQQLRRLVPRCLHAFSVRLHLSTLRRLLHQAGYSWKRTRRSLKRQRDPQAFAACQQQLAALHQAEQRGEVAVYYADEVRFSRQAPVPYAWQQRGQPAEELPAERGAGGGYSVLGFWRPADPQKTGRQAFMGWLSPTAFTADLFVAAVKEWLGDRHEPTVLVLDNASIHKAHLVQQHLAHWATQGLTLLFLPPYSPELNRIEILWRFCKHYWLTPAAYQTPDTLLQAVTQLIHDIGSPDYWITFA
ncbi:MAG: IS630 family transposase [Cytophagaceae bacterium]|nr:MAG: IS630 family transposase [Cytophagaceae bacterium]